MVKHNGLKAKWLMVLLSVLAIVCSQAASAATQSTEKSKQDTVTIPSTNPDDVGNKHRSWRKRKADLSKKDIQATKKTMKQKAISQGL